MPRQRSVTFGDGFDALQSEIGPIVVINLDRQPSRWTDMVRGLGRILDSQGVSLSNRVLRYSACDAQADPLELLDGTMVQPFYTLGDQLFVGPQPHAVPDAFDLERPIMMSQAEVAVACSHIGVWKTIAQSNACYSLSVSE
jgi:GR25 family glycosyltransferase involved in LPS biosynthesis